MDERALADELFFRQFLASEILLADTLNEGRKTQVLETSEEFREKTFLPIIEVNYSRLGFQCKEPTQRSVL